MTERRADRRTSKRLRLYLVERRKGKVWKYGSIVLCIALMAYLVGVLVR